MANYREEQLRSNRRLARQVTGAVGIILALIGLFTVLSWVVAGVRGLISDTDRKERYGDRVYGLVMLDASTFENVDNVDPAVFKQAAIWGTVYEVQKRGETLDIYARDPESGSALIPKLEIDTYIANLLGPDYVVPEGGFSTAEFTYQYDEASQCYLVPVTSGVAQFTPVVDSITTRSGLTYVTVGYIPTTNNSAAGEVLTAATEPTKYMDYVFTRGENRQWYLTALQTSEKQPASTPAPTEVPLMDDTQAMVENQLDATMFDTEPTAPEESPAEQPTESAGGEADSGAEGDAESGAEGDAQDNTEGDAESGAEGDSSAESDSSASSGA